MKKTLRCSLPLLILLCMVEPTLAGGAATALQIGVAEVDPAGTGCLTIRNPALADNATVTLVSLTAPQSTSKAHIAAKIFRNCSHDVDAPGDATFYTLRVARDAAEDRGPMIAVVGADQRLDLVEGRVRGDLDRDGKLESFRACASQEGLHLTVWSGEPLNSRRIWHRYYYLGYDVEPNCVNQDYE